MRSIETTIMSRPSAPFDFGLALGYLGRSPREVLDVVADGRYRRAVRLAGGPVLLEVASVGTVEEPALAVRLLAPTSRETPTGRAAPPASGVLEEVEALVARCFRIDQDPRGLEPIARADPVFGVLLGRLRGARAVVMPSPFEALIWAVLGQQISVTFAYALKQTLVGRYGERLEHAGRVYRLFPTPERLAVVSPDELRGLQFSRQKAEYVVSLAGLVAAGGICWAELRDTPTPDAVAVLSSHRGIGRWTAEYVCMRGLGHPDVLPAADLGLRAAVGRAYGLGRHATEPELRTLAARWAGWRSHAAFCWWYTLAPGLTLAGATGRTDGPPG